MAEDKVTQIEVKMVQNAPLAFELQAMGDAMVKLIKKLPVEAQPAALGAALLTVTGFQTAADAAVSQLPDFPPSLSPENISAEANALSLLYSLLPPGAPASVFDSGLQLLSQVDEMVSPTSTDGPTLPHQLSTSLINDQAELLRQYITLKAGS
jgi:hypothetical protein